MTTDRSQPNRPARRLLVLAVLALVALVLALVPLMDSVTGLLSGEPASELFQTRPEGFWHRERGARAQRTQARRSGEERARVLSLPYLGGGAPAARDARYGVVFHEPSRTRAGLNLYTSGHAPEAILMDMEGRPLHVWSLPFATAFPATRPTSDTTFFRRARLRGDGTLVALYQTGGLVFLDRSSRKLGGCTGNFYNDFWLDPDGERIWTIVKQARPTAEGGEVLDDSLVLLRFEGDGVRCREARRISIVDAFRSSPYADLLAPMAETGDRLHTNTVVELRDSAATAAAGFTAGQLLISLREVDVVAVIDPSSEQVVWAQRGPWDAQHDPSLVEGGRILLFDNAGGPNGRSRLLEIDPATGDVAWAWPDRSATRFHSAIAGACSRLPNGNTLVSESIPGRAFELDPGGRVVWEFRTPHRTGPDDELVAMLFEVERLPEEAARWLPR